MTQTMLGSMLTADLQGVQGQMLQVQQQLASGRRIQQPSDDPVGTENVLQWQNALDQNTQFQNNAKDATNWLQSTDSALQSAVGLAQQVRNLAVSVNTGDLNSTEYTAIANQVSALQASLVEVGNTKAGDHYLFNGDQTTTAPFTLAGTTVTFAGGTGNQMREVSPGMSIQANAPGSALMPLFAAITQIVTDLGSPATAGNVTGSDLGALDAALGTLTDTDGQVGAQLQQAQHAQGLLTDLGQSLQTLRGGTLNADMAKSVVQLQQLQVSYQSALAVGAGMMQHTLADYLK